MKVIARLKEEHPGKIRFSLVENTSRQDALEIYRSSDILIDQMMIGWYGGVAVEAMKMGVPVACYIEDSDLDFVPMAMRQQLPIYRVTMRTLYHDLQRLLKSRDLIPELAKKSRDYVNQWHDPLVISNHILDKVNLLD